MMTIRYLLVSSLFHWQGANKPKNMVTALWNGILAVHGFLHINGYDHYTPEEKEMFGLQEEILTAYGLTRQ